MKKLIVLVGALALGLSAYGQGSILFNNVGTGVNAPVLQVGGTAVPTGAAFTAELLAGATAGALTPVSGTATFAAPGVFLGSQRVLTGLAPASYPFFQVRVWENKGGTLTSYAAAVAAGNAQYGQSTVFQLANTTAGLGNPGATPPIPAPALVGMTGFTLVPEPSTYALLGLGALALLIRRRK